MRWGRGAHLRAGVGSKREAAVRYELKSWLRWAHWSDGAFHGQFLKDLASMAEGHPVKWVFDGSKLDRATVKRHVLEAMRDPGFRRRWTTS